MVLKKIVKFGITKKYFYGSLLYGLAATAAGFVILNAAALLVFGYKTPSFDALWLLFYIFISAPLQELVFRGILQTYLYRFGVTSAIVGASLIYAAAHFYNPVLMALTFPAGLVWGFLFAKKPSIIGPAVSHAILGAYLFVFIL